MKFPALILLMVFLLLQAGPAQAVLSSACGQEEAEPCAMACCELASCACLENEQQERPVAPAPPQRGALPAFVWVLTAFFTLPSSMDILSNSCHRAGPPAPCRTEEVSLSVLYCAFLT